MVRRRKARAETRSEPGSAGGTAPSRHEEDAALVARCLAGEQAAWDQLLVRHRPLVLAVARRCGLGPDEAEDVFQSTCVTLLERLELLRDHRSLAAWVATTTARKCWRLRGRPRDAELRDPGLAAPSRPEVEFVAAAEREAVRGALESLGEPCRTLLAALFVEERPYGEVARDLGLAVGSIGVYRRRCLDRLRRILERGGWLSRARGGYRE